MYSNGYIKLSSSMVSMNNEEYDAYTKWLNHRSYSIKGYRYYEKSTTYENDEEYGFRYESSMNCPNWFKLKCIARRIYDIDRANGIVHHGEFLTWLPTKSKGYHVVITNTGRVFHVICNKSRWGCDRRQEGREVVELKVDKDFRVRLGDCYKQSSFYTHRVLESNTGKVKKQQVYQVTVRVKPALIECFGRKMLSKTLPKGIRYSVLLYGCNTAAADASSKNIEMVDNDGNWFYFKSMREASEHFGVNYNTFKSKLRRTGGGGPVDINGKCYSISTGQLNRSHCGSARGRKKTRKAIAGKQRGFNMQRRIGASIKATKSYKSYMFRRDKRKQYGFLYDVYLKWKESAASGEMCPNDKRVIKSEVAAWVGEDCPRLSELAESIYHDANHLARIKRLRKHWGRVARKRRQREFMNNRENRDAWALKKATSVMDSYLSGHS